MSKTLFVYLLLAMLISSSICLVLKTSTKTKSKHHKLTNSYHLQEKVNQTTTVPKTVPKVNQTVKAQVKKQLQSNPQMSWFKTLDNETQSQFVDIVMNGMNNTAQNKNDVFSTVLRNKKIGPVVAEKMWKSDKGINQDKVKQVKNNLPQYKDLDFNNVPTDKKIEILLKLNQSGWLKQKKQK